MKLKDMLSKKKTVNRTKPVVDPMIRVDGSGSLLIHLTGTVDTVVNFPASEVYKYFVKEEHKRLFPETKNESNPWASVQCTARSSPLIYTSAARRY